MHKQSGKDSCAIDEQVKRILSDIDRQKEAFQKKGMTVTTLDENQLRRKLTRANSPMIVFQAWASSTTAGRTMAYNVGIHNPDPGGWVWLFGHVFFGPANMIPSVGQAMGTADLRLPTLTEPEFPGMNIAPGETVALSYAIPIPVGMPSTNYQGNTFLYQADWHDVGTYLDRGTFVFTVT